MNRIFSLTLVASIYSCTPLCPRPTAVDPVVVRAMVECTEGVGCTWHTEDPEHQKFNDIFIHDYVQPWQDK